MKVLIIGSKGFIGSHLLAFYREQGHTCYGSDVLVDYVDENYFLIDSTSADYSNIFETNQFDICVNCSGAASVPASIEKPLRDFRLNTTNVFTILNALKEHNPLCKFINLSSAAVYGNPELLPIHEESKLAPVSPYGKHKKMAEEICKEFYDDFGIKTCNLRIFSAYGDGLKKQLFWDLYQKQKTTNKITLFGTGKESRDFIYISDLVHAIACVVQNADFKGEAINIANGEELTIEKVTTCFYKLLNNSVNVDFGGEERKGDPINWVAENSKLQELGYKQKISIEEGLLNYVKWLKEEE